MKYAAVIDGKRVEIELTRERSGSIDAEIAGRKYQFDMVAVQPGVFWVNWNNQSTEVAITVQGDGYLVSVNGHRLPVEILDSRSALGKASQLGEAGAVDIRAPMPGKVVRVLVSEGDAVKANQGLVVIEAMKMQNEMKSPKTGVVTKLTVKEGTAVNAQDLLAIVE